MAFAEKLYYTSRIRKLNSLAYHTLIPYDVSGLCYNPFVLISVEKTE